MFLADVRLGLRVRRNGGASSLVQDRSGSGLRGRRVGIITTMPERSGNSSTSTVRVQWEGTSLSEAVHVHRLEPLPPREQPVALGGRWSPPPGTFVAKPPSI